MSFYIRLTLFSENASVFIDTFCEVISSIIPFIGVLVLCMFLFGIITYMYGIHYITFDFYDPTNLDDIQDGVN